MEGGKGGKVKGKKSLEVEGKGCKGKGKIPSIGLSSLEVEGKGCKVEGKRTSIGLSSLEVSCLEDSFCDVEVSSFCEVESWEVSSVFSKIESKNF